MNVRKFYASTTRDALRQVRDALGADAIILSNRQVAGGIEIMAVTDMDMSSLADNPVSPPPSKVRPKPAELSTRAVPPPPPPPHPPLPYLLRFHAHKSPSCRERASRL